MSKFFNLYTSILEKKLQKVRLRVDPINKCAEDFAAYDGYEGFILAETDDSFTLYSNNKSYTLPKKGFIIEGFLSGLAGTAPSSDASAGTALGTIGRKVAGTAARAVFGSQVTGNYAQPGPAASTTNNQVQYNKNPGMLKLPQQFHSKSFNITDKSGTAYIVSKGAGFYIIRVSLVDNPSTVLESKGVSDVFIAFSEAVAPPPIPNTKKGVRYIDITGRPDILNKNSFITIQDSANQAIYQGYGMITSIPNTTHFIVAFAPNQP